MGKQLAGRQIVCLCGMRVLDEFDLCMYSICGFFDGLWKSDKKQKEASAVQTRTHTHTEPKNVLCKEFSSLTKKGSSR